MIYCRLIYAVLNLKAQRNFNDGNKTIKSHRHTLTHKTIQHKQFIVNDSLMKRKEIVDEWKKKIEYIFYKLIISKSIRDIKMAFSQLHFLQLEQN